MSGRSSLAALPIRTEGEALRVALDYLARVTFAAAEVDYKANRNSQAISQYKRAVATDPHYISGHYKLAWVLATGRTRDGKLAVFHAEQAFRLDREYKWAYRLGLAIAHAEAGDFSAAQEHLKVALQRAPASDRATYRFLEHGAHLQLWANWRSRMIWLGMVHRLVRMNHEARWIQIHARASESVSS